MGLHAGADAIGIANGSVATGLVTIDGSVCGGMTLTFGDAVVEITLHQGEWNRHC